MSVSIENQIPSAQTNYWGTFNGQQTYLADCTCGCESTFVRYLGTNEICSVQTLFHWYQDLLLHEEPGYVLPAEQGTYGVCDGRETRWETCYEDSVMDFLPIVRYTDDLSECRWQTLHTRGAFLGFRLPHNLPLWLQFFLIGDSLLAQIEGRPDSIKASVSIEDHVLLLTPEQQAMVKRMKQSTTLQLLRQPGIWN